MASAQLADLIDILIVGIVHFPIASDEKTLNDINGIRVLIDHRTQLADMIF